MTSLAAALPDDVLALLDHHLLDLGGTYGDPEAGDPIQSDQLHVEHEQASGEEPARASKRGRGIPPGVRGSRA